MLAILASLRSPSVDVWVHLWQTQFLELIANTLLLLTGVGAGTLIIGTGLAWLVTAYRFPGRSVFDWMLVLPLAMPAYIIGFAFLGLFDFAGPVASAARRWSGGAVQLPDPRSWWGVMLMMTLVFYPYVYLLARAAFREQGLAALEAARSLGRSRRRAFFEVVLPMARPSLVAGTSLAMMEALADFGTVSLFGYRTLTEAVYRVWNGMFDRLAAMQLACVLMGVAFTLLLIERTLRGRRRFSQGRRSQPAIVATPLHGWRAVAGMGACTAVLALAFVLPVGQLLAWAADQSRPWAASALLHLLGSTFLLAGAAAAVVCTLALVLAYAVRLHGSPIVRLTAGFASMGYAMPGAVIAVGVLAPVAAVDRAIDGLAQAVLGRPLGVVLTGSVAVVLFAYAVRFLAVGLQTVEASLVKIPPRLDEAARSLGLAAGPTLRRVHLPLLRGGLLTAALLVWVEVMKELPATLLLRPLGLKTLAIEVWERTSESMWAEAALPAVTIVLVGLAPLLITSRLTSNETD